ncbi:MAG: GNAT family N-acetyltransferase [Firmicutes bacterium]|nr:GNAT family N-acetyltransferase [Bacillota bacterium]
MAVRISALTEENAAAGADIIRRSFATVAAVLGLTKENCPSNGAFIEDAKLLDEYRRGIEMFGLFDSGRLVGFMALERKDTDLFYLEKLAVLPEFRHNGYGGMLVDFARNTVRHKGGKTLSIGVIHENTRLVRWYEALGFAHTQIRKYDHLPFAVCFMRLAV